MSKNISFLIGFLPPLLIALLSLLLVGPLNQGDGLGKAYFLVLFSLPLLVVSFFMPGLVGLIGKFTSVKLEGHYGLYGSLVSFCVVLFFLILVLIANP